jgi:hypothetical protein
MAKGSITNVLVMATNSNVRHLCDDDFLVEFDAEITDGDYAAAGRVSLQLRCVDGDEPLIVPSDDDLSPELRGAFRWLGKRRYMHAVSSLADHAFDLVAQTRSAA